MTEQCCMIFVQPTIYNRLRIYFVPLMICANANDTTDTYNVNHTYCFSERPSDIVIWKLSDLLLVDLLTSGIITTSESRVQAAWQANQRFYTT